MSQITHGIILGSPGVAGSSPIAILYGVGNPANSNDPNVSIASQGSLFIDAQTPALYFKTSPTAWNFITIP
jgi:hypothetical protein